MFAILSLRSLYSIVAHAVNDLPYLEKAIGAVLVFVGAKMLVESRGIAISTTASLAFVLVVLGVGTAASLARKRRRKGSPLLSSAVKHI
jgi:predicted tellurium resistance membrane protein TerC